MALSRRFAELLVICLVGLAAPLITGAAEPAQSPAVFEHLTTAEGLPQSTVNVTYRDSVGFVWIGTEDGLVRYDGHRLVRYGYRAGDASALPGNYIKAIVEADDHDLWIGIADGGLAHWHRQSDRFTIYRHQADNAQSLASDDVTSLAIDHAGRLWIGTHDAGLDVLDAQGRMTHFGHAASEPDSLVDDHVRSLARGRGDVMWIGTEAGLDRTQGTGSFEHCPPAGGARGQGASTIYVDADGSTWQGAIDGGLIQRDLHGTVRTFLQHDPRHPGSLANNNVRAILRDREHRLWVGTDGGLDLYDAAAGSFAHYFHEEGNSHSLSDSSVMSLYQDAGGLMWVGTRLGGLNRWNPRSWDFGGRRPAWLNGSIALAFADGGDGRLWVGTWGGGLKLYDPQTGAVRSVDEIVGHPHALGDDRVMALARDATGTLWIGTMSVGLRSLTADGRLEAYTVQPGSDRGISAPAIMSLYAGPDGRVWIGTHGGGANVLNPRTGMITQLPFGTATGAISGANVTSMVADTQGHMWFGTDGGGLDLADSQGHVLYVFRHSEGDPASIASDAVNAVTLDSSNRLWVATDRGLALMHGAASDPAAIRFQIFGRAQGLAGDTVYAALPDAAGRIWSSGNTGLSQYDPRTGDFRTYHVEHGLQNEEFESGAYLLLADGRLVFGSPGGFNFFDPQRIDSRRSAPPVTLTRVDVLGLPLKSDTPFWLLHDIHVAANARIITLGFAALDFTSPQHNRLSYRVPDLSDRWIELGNEHNVTLTNLPSGDHWLEVRAATADSLWSEQPLRLLIHKAPPWYASWQAQVGYVLLALVTLGIAWRIHLRRLERAERIRRLAYFDSLTGLPNRQQCLDLAAAFAARARADGGVVTFIYLDLDGFKRINDTFGHAVGDEMLRIVAAKLTKGLEHYQRAAEIVLSRFGGDEFVVLVRHAPDSNLGADIASDCRKVLSVPINYQRLEITSVPSIGIARFPDDGDSAEAVLEHADTAMYQAKAAAAGQVVTYEPAMSSRIARFVKTESRLRRALQLEAITFEYQPKFRLSDNEMVGAEMLARWHDEELGVVSPADFIPVAEESGLIMDMGEQLIRTACRQVRAWRDLDIGLPLAINISSKELLHGDPARVLEHEARAAGIPPSQIEIEITESLMVQDSPAVRRALDRLRDIGCLLALDDFGTGYSSLSYLTRFPPDKIKIDKSFVRHVDQSSSDAAVAQAILSLAGTLRMTVTAEGIERRSQLEWLRNQGCNEGQGFFLSRPLSADRLVNFLADRTQALPRSGAA